MSRLYLLFVPESHLGLLLQNRVGADYHIAQAGSVVTAKEALVPTEVL